jgi:hypothetical protein
VFLRRACFDGDTELLKEALRVLTPRDLCVQDKHGLSPIHIAAMRDREACVRMLIEFGCNIRDKSSLGWLPYQEAACYKSRRALTVILGQHRRLFESRTREKLQKLRLVLADMPNCAFQV